MQIDDSIYESTKAQFETAMGLMVGHYRDGNYDRGYAIFTTLIETYNNSVDSNKRMLQKIHQLEQK